MLTLTLTTAEVFTPNATVKSGGREARVEIVKCGPCFASVRNARGQQFDNIPVANVELDNSEEPAPFYDAIIAAGIEEAKAELAAA